LIYSGNVDTVGLFASLAALVRRIAAHAFIIKQTQFNMVSHRSCWAWRVSWSAHSAL